MSEPAILTTAALAKQLGVSRFTLHAWGCEKAEWRRCVVIMGKGKWWWSVQKLRDAGFLTKPEAPTTPLLTATYRYGAFALLVLLCGCSDGRINPGAKVAIYDHVSADWMYERVHGERSDSHAAAGLTVRGPVEALYFARSFDGPSVHEYEHLIEGRLMASGNLAAVRICRHTFRDLCSPTYEIGNADLLTEIP